MTENLVDLTNLRMATGGDHELEKELFDEFIRSSETILQKLQSNYGAQGDNEAWRSAAHAMKGISLNLGARTLADFCKQGQEGFERDEVYKSDLLGKITEERTKVIEYLKAQ